MQKFRDFYIGQKERLFGYLLRRTGNYHLSADIMQESFAKYLEVYNHTSPNPALLYTISRNLLVDLFRRQRPETEYNDNHHQKGDGQEDQYILKEESRRVLAAIQQLDSTDADILALVVGSSMSYKEISGLTGISEGNVKIRVHRARLKVKKILEQGENE